MEADERRGGRVRVFLAMSLDGFLAGEGDDLSFLPPPDAGGDDGGFAALLAEVGALLMGRRTFEVVSGFDGPWPYGELPVLVATSRPLASPVATVRAVRGTVPELLAEARRAAAGRDIYVDGGALVRSVLDAGAVDELTVTVVPVVLARGVPLFRGLLARRDLTLSDSRALPHGLVQLRYRLTPER